MLLPLPSETARLRTSRRKGLLNLGGGRRAMLLPSAMFSVIRHSTFDAAADLFLIDASIAFTVRQDVDFLRSAEPSQRNRFCDSPDRAM